MGACSVINMKRKNSVFKPIKSTFSPTSSHNSRNRQKQNYLDSIKSTFILKDVFSFLKRKNEIKNDNL